MMHIAPGLFEVRIHARKRIFHHPEKEQGPDLHPARSENKIFSPTLRRGPRITSHTKHRVFASTDGQTIADVLSPASHQNWGQGMSWLAMDTRCLPPE